MIAIKIPHILSYFIPAYQGAAMLTVVEPPAPNAAHDLTLRFDPSEPELEQAVRAVLARMPGLMERRRRALQERDIEALLDLFAPAPGSEDPDKLLIADNAEARHQFLADFHCLTSREVAQAAGHKAKNVSVTASRWKQAGRLFSVPRAGEELYPEFQFQDGKPHPAVAAILAELPKRKTSWQIAFWFTSGNGWLDGAAPFERLDETDRVVRAARHEAEDFAG
jgi:hypothetical protein